MSRQELDHGFRGYQVAVDTEAALAAALVLLVLVKGLRSPEWPAAFAVLGMPFVAAVVWSPLEISIGWMLIVTSETALIAAAGLGLLRNLRVARRAGSLEL